MTRVIKAVLMFAAATSIFLARPSDAREPETDPDTYQAASHFTDL
jgi:hypothetical protein